MQSSRKATRRYWICRRSIAYLSCSVLISRISISPSVRRTLRSGNVFRLADLVVLDADTLSKFRNFGKKSMDELNELMERLGLTFGMDVSKYNLDND